MLQYHKQSARRSDLSLLPFKIVFADYRALGIYEQNAPNSHKLIEELEHALLNEGYHGPAVAVIQYGSDQFLTEAKVNERLELTYGEIGVADGKHRLQALDELYRRGILRQPFIPVQLIPAHDTNLVRTATMDANEKPLPVSAIEDCFEEAARTIPLYGCTTHFQTKLSNGEWVRLREGQPDLIIPPSQLF